MAKSKFAAELEKRGFERVAKHSRFKELTQRDGKRGGTPSFTRGTDGLPITFATDETHYMWVARGNVDLSDLGFTENTERAHAILARMLEEYRRSKMH